MKQSKIIEAYKMLDSFSDNSTLSYSVLWDLYQLKKSLQIHMDFFNSQLELIRNKYISFADENGNISGEPYQNYLNDIAQLGDMDKDVSSILKPTIKLSEFPGITMKTMDAIGDFVNFEKE